MQYLVFQLKGALASWGEAAVGEYRGTHDAPSDSALSGLMCAALGLRRNEEEAIQAVHHAYRYAVGVCLVGPILRDYHTAQVPSRSLLKGARHATRKDELAFPRPQLGTILSTRDHVQDAEYLVAAQADSDSPFTLAELRKALCNPVFVPYLGRRACPLGAPMAPKLIDAQDVLAAFADYRSGSESSQVPIARMTWCDGLAAGVPATLTVRQHDRLIHRGAWQYGERNKHVAIFLEEAEHAI